SRFTTPAAQCPSISPEWESPQGVPISAIFFGGRRASLVPLVYQAFDWPHGVFLGATMNSETTAAATAKVGVVRTDPMAMLPFCGYNMGDYFAHWLHMGTRVAKLPLVFRVNWFRQGADGRFLWPGFGDNLRVLRWAIARVYGEVGAAETPLGFVPHAKDLDTSGLDLAPAVLEELLRVDRTGWLDAAGEQRKFLERFGTRMPGELLAQNDALVRRLGG
ncbi:MAG TPA: phosphoenolpyruvate carboxykinase domain-containing protein, partial [Candidatus Binatia bacterium]|nr:phosphoenolpyruvate carboxykinase domain-containing protein [Candidatus Binatia bacterium]